VPQIITVNKDRYLVLGTVSVNSDYSPEELKREWNADTVLRNDDLFYITRKIINAEFQDLK
jgi:hypothetical protein